MNDIAMVAVISVIIIMFLVLNKCYQKRLEIFFASSHYLKKERV